MICSNSACANTLPDDSSFCDRCGSPVAIPKTDAATAFATRPAIPMDPDELAVSLPDNRHISLQSGAVLGRLEGPLSAHWNDAPLVSARHGRVDFDSGRWTFTDLYSANGTILNDHFVRPGQAVTIQSGDTLVLGNRRLTIV